MSRHQPLSPWIVPLEGDRLGPVNFGAERVDARGLDLFSEGWRHEPLRRDDRLLLALRNDTTGTVVVEVDETARPIEVTEPQARWLANWEDGVPYSGMEPLSSVPLLVRLLLNRWSVEGEPPASAYHHLPWQDVSALADDVAGQLRGEPPGSLIMLRAAFASVGTRFSAALEQLDEAVREDAPGLTRAAGTALCERLSSMIADRAPENARWALARVVLAIKERDRLISHWAEATANHLLLDGGVPDHPPSIATELRAAAAADHGIRRSFHRFVRDPFHLEMAVTGTGRFEFSARLDIDDQEKESLAFTYGTVILRVRVVTGEQDQLFYLPLPRFGSELSGELDLPLPADEVVEAEVEGPPIGTAEIGFLSEEDITRSINALSSNELRDEWAEIAGALPPAHPSRELIARLVGER